MYVFRVFFKVLSSWSFFRGKWYSHLEIQYGGQNVTFVLSCHSSKICPKESPHQNVFELTLIQKSFYVFRKDRQSKLIFLLSPSLDQINIISVQAPEGSSRQNLAEKPAYFTSCRLLSTTLMYYRPCLKSNSLKIYQLYKLTNQDMEFSFWASAGCMS